MMLWPDLRHGLQQVHLGKHCIRNRISDDLGWDVTLGVRAFDPWVTATSCPPTAS